MEVIFLFMKELMIGSVSMVFLEDKSLDNMKLKRMDFQQIRM